MPQTIPKLQLISVQYIRQNDLATSHLTTFLSAFPDRVDDVRKIITPLMNLCQEEGDQVRISNWRPSKPAINQPPHAHLLVSEKGRVYTDDNEIFYDGTRKTKEILPKGGTSDLIEGIDWLSLSLDPKSVKDSFFIIQNSIKTRGKMYELPTKHPELYGILSGIRKQLESLPTLEQWYPEYVKREKNKAIEEHNAKSKRKLPLIP